MHEQLNPIHLRVKTKHIHDVINMILITISNPNNAYSFYNICAKKITCASWTVSPTLDFCNNVTINIYTLYRLDIWIYILPSGSDHSKSHMAPSWGTSCFLSIVRICNRMSHLPLCEAIFQWYYLIQCVYTRGETTMNTEYFIINNSTQAQIIENLATISPHISWSKFTCTFVIKAIHLCNLSTFVISSNKSNSVRVSYFQRQ